MKFIVDAQLPKRMAQALSARGHDCLHTKDLPSANRTRDQDVLKLARTEDRAVISKDRDFVVSFVVRDEPRRLLLIATGNIDNNDLLLLLDRNISQIEALFCTHRFLEMDRTRLLVHK